MRRNIKLIRTEYERTSLDRVRFVFKSSSNLGSSLARCLIEQAKIKLTTNQTHSFDNPDLKKHHINNDRYFLG